MNSTPPGPTSPPFPGRPWTQMLLLGMFCLLLPSCWGADRRDAAPADERLVRWPSNQLCFIPEHPPKAVPRPEGEMGYQRWQPPASKPIHLTELNAQILGSSPEAKAELLSLTSQQLEMWKRRAEESSVIFSSDQLPPSLINTEELIISLKPGGATLAIVNLFNDEALLERDNNLSEIKIPIPASQDADDPLTLSINVAEMIRGNWRSADQEPRLSTLSITLEGATGLASLEKITFIGPEAKFAHAAAGNLEAEVKKVLRPSWFVHGGASAVMEITLPDAPSELRWHDALKGSAETSRQIIVTSFGRAQTLSSLQSAGDTWTLQRASLAPWKGQKVRVALKAEGDGVALFGDPRIVPLEGESQSPNVLLVLIDTLRADKLDAWSGEKRGISPTMDRLAQEGVMFAQAQSTSPWTKPSIPSILTGLFPTVHRIGATAYDSKLPESVPTLQDHIRLAGWRTGSFAASALGSTLSHLDQGFDVAYPPRYWSGNVGEMGHPAADQLFAAFKDWFEEEPEQPFMAYMHTLEVHEYQRPLYHKGGDDLLPAYFASIQDMDGKLADLLAFLDEKGKLSNTLVVLVSDHGEAFGEHLKTGHGTSVYQHQLHVPLIFWAGDALPSMTVTTRVSTMDIANTVLDLLKVPLLPDVQGLSLLPLIDGGPQTPIRPYTPAARIKFVHTPDDPVLWTLVSAQGEKIIQTEGRGSRLYDLSSSPCETTFLVKPQASDSNLVTLLPEWQAEQEQLRESYERAHPDEGPSVIRSSNIEELRLLGYIE